MRLIKKELLRIPADRVPKGWHGKKNSQDRFALTAGWRKYQDGEIFTATWHDKKDKPVARIFMNETAYITYLHQKNEWRTGMIEKIAPGNNSYITLDTCATAFDEKTEKAIKRLYCGYGTGARAIYWAQYSIQGLKKRAQAKKRIQQSKKIPIDELEPAPPENLIPWLRAHGFACKEYMYLKSVWAPCPLGGPKSRQMEGRCSACGQVMDLDILLPGPGSTYTNVMHGQRIYCPHCGSDVECRAWGKSNNGHEQKSRVLVISKVGPDVVAIGYEVARYTYRDRPEGYNVAPMNAYVFTGGKGYRFAQWYGTNNYGGIEFLDQWDSKEGIVDFGWEYTYPIDETTLRGTCLENSMVWDYVQRMQKGGHHYYNYSPMKYCSLYLKHPGIENLQREGFQNLVQEKLMRGKIANKAVNWKEFSPAKMLDLNRAELARAIKEKWDCETLLYYKQSRAAGWEMQPEDIGMWKALKETEIDKLKLAPKTVLKLHRYIRKMHRKHPDQEYVSIASTWKDYYQAGLSLEYDLENPGVLFPGKLGEAHDKAVEAREYSEDPALIAKFAKMYKTLLPLSWEFNGLIIRPAGTERELIAEGRVLAHCVGQYGKGHCDGKPILFIRRKSDPGLPYYTLQLDLQNKKILQCRGYKNNQYQKKPEDVSLFEQMWLETMVKNYDFSKKRFTKTTQAIEIAV